MKYIAPYGCIFCGKKILPWQRVRATKRDGGMRIVCHAKCYNRRLEQLKND